MAFFDNQTHIYGLYDSINMNISMGNDNQTDDEKEIEKYCKIILQIIAPLKSHISSADIYLLNGVDIR